jgi:hypothetical protein
MPPREGQQYLVQLPLGPAPVAEANDGFLALTVTTPSDCDRLLTLHCSRSNRWIG